MLISGLWPEPSSDGGGRKPFRDSKTLAVIQASRCPSAQVSGIMLLMDESRRDPIRSFEAEAYDGNRNGKT